MLNFIILLSAEVLEEIKQIVLFKIKSDNYSQEMAAIFICSLFTKQTQKLQQSMVSDFGNLLLPHNPSVWFIEAQ